MIWDFLQRYDESWIWRCTDRHEVTESSRNFAALPECVSDATLHGYSEPQVKVTERVSGRPGERKRRRKKTAATARPA